MKNLLEATHIHHGSIRDLQTFLDQNGDPMELTPTSIEDLMRQAEERGKSRSTNSDSDEKFDGPEAPGGKNDSSSSKKSDETPTGDNDGSANGSEDEEDNGDVDGDGEGPESEEDKEGGNQGKGSGKPGDSEGEGEGESEGEGEQNEPQPPSGPPNMPNNQEQQKPQDPPEPEFKTPEKGQMFRDIITGKTYKWDGKKFVIQR